MNIEHSFHAGEIALRLVEIERQPDPDVARAGRDRGDAARERRRNRRDKTGERIERRGGCAEIHLPGGGGTIERAVAVDGHAVGIADPQPLQRHQFRVIGQPAEHRLQRLAADAELRNVERNIAFVRPRLQRATERARKRRGGVEIQLLGFQRRFQPAPVAIRAEREFALHPTPIDLRRQSVHRHLPAGDDDIAARLQGLLDTIGVVAMALQPQREAFRIAGVEMERAGEHAAVTGLGDAAGQRHARRARRTKFQALDRPFAGVSAQFDRRILNRPRAEIDEFRIDSQFGRDRHRRRGRDQAAQARQHLRGRRRGCVTFREKAIRIQLPRTKRGARPRACAESRLRLAGKFQARLLRPEHHLHLIEPRGRRIGIQFAGEPPRHRRILRRRPAERQRTVEARHRPVELQDAVKIGRERALGRLKRQPHALAAAVRRAPGRETERSAQAVHLQRALAANAAGQRPHLAGEGDIVELQRPPIRGVAEQSRAGDVKLVDRQRAEIEAARPRAPVEAALLVQRQFEDQPVQRQFVGAPFAAHQLAKAEFDVELFDADIVRITARTDRNPAQAERGRRQQPRIDRPVDAHRQADHARCLALELRPELAPVDEIRTDKGRQQRKNDSYGKSEQRRLHGNPLTW